MQSDKNYRLPRARGGRGLKKVFTKFCSNHEIFTTKIKTFSNLERFTKFLYHENLELYGNWKYMHHQQKGKEARAPPVFVRVESDRNGETTAATHWRGAP